MKNDQTAVYSKITSDQKKPIEKDRKINLPV
jgi:hypothetical protein